LISCSNVTDTDTSYCCDHTDKCCDSGVGRFEVLPSKAQTWATWNTASTQYVVVKTFADASTSTSLSTLASTTSASSITSISTTTSQTAVPTAEETEVPVGLTTAAQAGIGVGAAVGALLIAAIVFLLWKMRKNKKMMMQQQDQETRQPTYQYPYAQPAPMNMNIGATRDPWFRPRSEIKQPQELDGYSSQGYGVRAELPGNPI
jgi:hypothetical protein